MASPISILLRLDMRHAAHELRWAFWAAGTDLEDERDVIDRIYQFYIVLIVLGLVASSWIYALDTARDAGASFGTVAASVCSAALGAAPLLALALRMDEAFRGCPVHLSTPDIIWLGNAIPKGSWALASIAKNLVANAIVAGCGGYLLGAFGEGALGPAAPAALSILMGLGALTGSALGNAAGMARMAPAQRPRLVAGACLAAGAAACAALGGQLASNLHATCLAPSSPSPYATGPLALACAAGAVSLILSARAARMDRIIDANGIHADMYALRHLRITPGGGALYRKILRAKRLESRRFRQIAPIGSGPFAPLSHAAISHLRQPLPLMATLMLWGAVIIPWGAVLATSAHPFMTNLVWLVVAMQSMESAREVTRVFSEDCRNRLVRASWPFNRIQLLLADSAIAALLLLSCSFATTLLASRNMDAAVIVQRLAFCSGAVVALVASAVLDDPSYKPGTRKPAPDIAFIALCAGAMLFGGAEPTLGVAALVFIPVAVLYAARD